jgi:hypothetical protein
MSCVSDTRPPASRCNRQETRRTGIARSARQRGGPFASRTLNTSQPADGCNAQGLSSALQWRPVRLYEASGVLPAPTADPRKSGIFPQALTALREYYVSAGRASLARSWCH